MPIKLAFKTTEQEFDVPEAFVVIEEVNTRLVGEQYHSVTVAIYKSRVQYTNGKQPIERQTLRREINQGTGFNAKGFYDWLKTLPQFPNATDEG